jgi:hypothetical protein
MLVFSVGYLKRWLGVGQVISQRQSQSVIAVYKKKREKNFTFRAGLPDGLF